MPLALLKPIRASGFIRNGPADRPSWQLGYGAFGVSKSNIPEVEDYIRRQEKHHGKLTYKEEFPAFLSKHGIDKDERYVWD